jgi:hypothetical protein
MDLLYFAEGEELEGVGEEVGLGCGPLDPEEAVREQGREFVGALDLPCFCYVAPELFEPVIEVLRDDEILGLIDGDELVESIYFLLASLVAALGEGPLEDPE